MKLSIIVPIYNAEKYLEKCLKSILNQDLKDWECFLIDDGSKDRSSTICDFYALKDSRFKFVRKFNEGPGAARNLGIYLAKGEWLGFVDADDWLEPNHFSYLLRSVTDAKLQIAQTAINVYKNGLFTKKWHLGEPGVYNIEDGKLLSNPTYDIGHCWDKIYKTSLIKENEIVFADCDMCEDTIFNIKALCKAGRILSLENTTYNYNIQNDSLSHSNLKDARKIRFMQSFGRLITDLEKDSNFSFIEANVKKHFENILTRPSQIDYVFPYVDCTKAQWQNQYKKYNSVIDFQRFNAHEDLLKYKFRAIEKWMPWISVIHMIVSDKDQVPDWIDQSKVHIVTHKEFIPEEYLPTFNSCTIEMFLHKIPGLSEKFIYANDDMYPNDVLKPKFYFPEESILKADLHIRKLWHEGDINQIWAQIPVNSLKLAAKDKPAYLKKYVDGVHLYELQHVGKPMLKSVNTEVFEKYKTEISESITRFREAKNLNQYLFTEYALFHEHGVFETFRFRYFQVGIETKKILEALQTTVERPRAICCNDSDRATDEDYKQIAEAFQKLYPCKCSYEV